MSARANSTNSTGTGTSQVSGGQVATASTGVTTFPHFGTAITVTRAVQGASVGDAVERDSDGGFWDTTANVNVSPENTNITTAGVNDMLSVG